MGSKLSDIAYIDKDPSNDSLKVKFQDGPSESILRSEFYLEENNYGNQEIPRTQHGISFSAENFFENIKLAFETDPGTPSKNAKSIPAEAFSLSNNLESIKPINAAIHAFHKRKAKGSTSSLSSKGSQSGFGSNLSLNDFYGSHSNMKERSSSKSSLKKDPVLKNGQNRIQPSPRTIQQNLLQLDHTIREWHISQRAAISQLQSLPLEKLGDNIEIKKRTAVISKYRMKKFNSTSTLFIDSCLVNSEIEEYLKYFSFYIQNLIRINYENISFKDAPGPDILSEKLHPLSKHIQFFKKPVSKKDIFRFLECIFQSADLGVENVLITIIYIQRLLRNTNICIQHINWTRIILGAVLLASKVWDDHAIWNVDFTQIFPEVSVADLNELESFYLSALEYNVNVKPGNYARVYFELRDICAFYCMSWALDPLKRSESSRIQIKEQKIDDPNEEKEENSSEKSDSKSSVPVKKLPLFTRAESETKFKSIDRHLFI